MSIISAHNLGLSFGARDVFSGISVDSDGTFWIANEFANTELLANWGTTIGHFTLVEPTPTRDSTHERAMKAPVGAVGGTKNSVALANRSQDHGRRRIAKPRVVVLSRRIESGQRGRLSQ